MTNNTLVSIVIANFNGEKHLEVCLPSILKSKHKRFELLLIDDGSNDRSINIINKYVKKDDRLKLFRNKKNLGASASRNEAIKKVKGDIVVFLDNDTEVKPDWIDKLIASFKKDRNVGAVQSLLLDFEKRDTIQMAGGKLIPHVVWLAPYHHGKSYLKVGKILKTENIVAISAALAVKKEVVDKVRGFDVMESVTTEDLDFCWRIWIAGYKIKLSPDSIVYHRTKKVKERGYIKDLENIYFHLAKNSLRSMIKNYQFENAIKYIPFTLLINIGRGIFFIVKRKNASALKGTIRAIIWNSLLISDTLSERKRIQRGRKVNDKVLFREIMSQDSLIDVYKKYFS